VLRQIKHNIKSAQKKKALNPCFKERDELTKCKKFDSLFLTGYNKSINHFLRKTTADGFCRLEFAEVEATVRSTDLVQGSKMIIYESILTTFIASVIILQRAPGAVAKIG
jgi:hypothetical protein